MSQHQFRNYLSRVPIILAATILMNAFVHMALFLKAHLLNLSIITSESLDLIGTSPQLMNERTTFSWLLTLTTTIHLVVELITGLGPAAGEHIAGIIGR